MSVPPNRGGMAHEDDHASAVRLSYRDVEQLLAERGIEVDHVTVYRWVRRFGPPLARRIQHLTSEIDELTERISEVLARHAPELLERRGVGPDSAATLLITTGDNPKRLANEASFAALCGASPIQASSGKTRPRRLNRGGDRQANAALYPSR